MALQGVVGLSADDPRGFAVLLMTTTAITTVVWLAVTYLTAPEPREVLRAFYHRARPGGAGWTAVAPEATADAGLGRGFVQWAVGCVVVYLGLFGIGDLVLGRPVRGVVLLVVGGALTAWLVASTAGNSPESRMV
jgi:hypothetical protein